MEFSTAAIASIVALGIVVAISCVNEDLNVGFLSIGFAIIVAGLFGKTTGAAVMKFFPVSLFMILVENSPRTRCVSVKATPRLFP